MKEYFATSLKKSGNFFVSFSKYRTFALANGNRYSNSNT
jgi:hypothetical protein